jgi:hypothetical protein
MRKVIAIFAIATLVACGGASTEVSTTDSTAVAVDSTSVAADSTECIAPNDTTATK